ncbi:hypothetical protein ACFYXF_11270 [Streptomyces sp. NPDC002680]|uniref:hypothetical protein n=1 Tax=Streptomyces sp. NPDC002680 TaxID=3364659 RepID=UPI0036AF4E9E
MNPFTRRHRQPGPPSAPARVAAVPATGPTENLLLIKDERMPSRVSSVHFTVRIDGAWQPLGDTPPPHGDPSSFARHHLRAHTARILRRHSVLETPAAQDAVNATIARPWSPEPWLVTRGVVLLAVTGTDQDLAEEHLRRAQHGDLDREETNRRVDFLQLILSDPDRRAVWWIDQYPDRLGELAQLSKAVADLKPPRDSTHDGLHAEVTRFVDQLLTDLHTPHQREIFLRALTQTLRTLGSTDLQTTAARWLSGHLTEPGVDTA